MDDLVLYGASGHAKVVIECALSMGIKIAGIFDDDREKIQLMDVQVIGSYKQNEFANLPMIISIGDNKIRSRLAAEVSHKFATVVHNSAIVSSTATIGLGSVVFQGAVIQAGSNIGNHVIINTSAVVDHDCIVEDFVHIAPNATVCGGVTIKKGAQVSAGAVIIPGVEIGEWAIVGAGSVITKNVEDFSVVVGNEGRIIRYNN